MKALLMLLAALVLCDTLAGNPLTAEISYLAADQCYLNSGSSSGVAVGDSVRVLDENGTELAWLQVVFVARSSSAARILETNVELHIGMAVQILIQPTREAQSIVQPAPETQFLRSPSAQIASDEKKGNALRLAARISTGLELSRWEQESTLREPWVRISVGVRNLTSYGHRLSLHMRALRSMQKGQDKEDMLRISELAFENAPQAHFHYSLGLTRVNGHAGIGVIRGVVIESGFHDGLLIGAFGGVSPLPGEDELNAGRSQFGMRVQGEHKLGSISLDGGLAFAGRYREGEYEQEFLSQFVHLRKGRQFSIRQSTQLELNREWRVTDGSQRLELSRFHLRMDYVFSRELRINLSADAGQAVRPFSTRANADSLFDENPHRGLRLGANFPLGSWLMAESWSSVRRFASLDGDSYHAGLRVHHRDPLPGSVFLQGRLAWFSNAHAEGWQPSLLGSRRFSRITLNTEFGLNRLNDADDGTNLWERWFRSSFEWYPNDVWTLAFSGELQLSSAGDHKLLSIECAWRL